MALPEQPSQLTSNLAKMIWERGAAPSDTCPKLLVTFTLTDLVENTTQFPCIKGMQTGLNNSWLVLVHNQKLWSPGC